jgi:peptidyl-dipeptidase A
VTSANDQLQETWVAEQEALWAYETDLTDEHEATASAASERTMATLTRLIGESRPYAGVNGLDPDTARALHLLGIATALPAPNDDTKRAELADLATDLSRMYGEGESCVNGECRDLGELEEVLATNRDPQAQLDAWVGWHSISPAMRPKYSRFVELTNEGARGLGFANTGELWRSGYDMSPAEVEAEADRLWGQVKPLYEQLHCYVRAELAEEYGTDVVNPTGTIPAHLTGNMWAQSWDNIYPLVAPFPNEPAVDYTPALQTWDELRMVRTGEAFFTSMGFDPLPQTFWERSMFLQPEDREVVCHASAWDVSFNDDLRLKMCIKRNSEDFVTIHHELGHHYYFHEYHTLPVLFQNGAHDGFHEAIGTPSPCRSPLRTCTSRAWSSRCPPPTRPSSTSRCGSRWRRSRSCRSVA